MVVTSTAAVLLLQVVLFVRFVLVFFILSNDSVCFAQTSQSHGNFNFPETFRNHDDNAK